MNPIRIHKWSLLSVGATLMSFGIYFHLPSADLWLRVVGAAVFVASFALAIVAMFKEPMLRYGIIALCLSLINFLIHASG